MLSFVTIIFDYIKYLLFSKSRHGTHSPFVYEFADKVLYANYQNTSLDYVEIIRQKMLNSDAVIEVSDFGAVKNKHYKAPISKLVARSAKAGKYAKLLSRICAYYQPQIALELGTNFGISAMYQAAMLTHGNLITIEGSNSIADVAEYNIKKVGLHEKITLIRGNFDEVLPQLLPQLPKIDYAFIDGNHRKLATLKYFEMLLSKVHNNSILVFDDIRWNVGMEEAWEEIKKHPRVSVTIDLFFLGIVFFRSEQQKEDFVLRF
jgi:predicted O-methyltransferase YrrM